MRHMRNTIITWKKQVLTDLKFFNPWSLIKNMWTYRDLILQFIYRDFMIKYKGSYLGFVWSLVNPLLMIAVYTFVFNFVFKSKWNVTISDSRFEFSLTLFCGLIFFTIFNECVNRASGIILCYPSYVKKVVFPLEILPVVIMGSSLIHAGISIGILLIAAMFFLNIFSWTIIYLPLILFPLIILTLGLSWMLASLGVYIRDVGYTVGIFTQILFFLTPIFYPIDIIPSKYQFILRFNPLTTIIEDSRRILLWNLEPEWKWLILITVFSLLVNQLGYFWFMKTKKGFADVI